MRIPVVGISGNVQLRIPLRSFAFPRGSKRGKCFAFFYFAFFALFGIACIFGENVRILRAIFSVLRTSLVLVRFIFLRLYQQIGQGGEVPFSSFGGFQPYLLYLGRGQYPLLLIGFGVEKAFSTRMSTIPCISCSLMSFPALFVNSVHCSAFHFR